MLDLCSVNANANVCANASVKLSSHDHLEGDFESDFFDLVDFDCEFEGFDCDFDSVVFDDDAPLAIGFDFAGHHDHHDPDLDGNDHVNVSENDGA